MKIHYKFIFGFCTLLTMGVLLYSCTTMMPTISYANISVQEEGGVNFVKITEDADAVAGMITSGRPLVSVGSQLLQSNSSKMNITWWVNPRIAISPDGQRIAYINNKNKMQNVMVKGATVGGSSTQRTFRNAVTDFSWSPDGKRLSFTEYRNNRFGIYFVNADQGSVVQQISSGNDNDFAPIIDKEGKFVFFHRGEGYETYSLWSFDIEKTLFSNYSRGMTPCLDPANPSVIYCGRFTSSKESEIWKLNIETGVEEILLSQPGKSFTTPQISPDRRWILCTGSSLTPAGVQNTDIFVISTDGTLFTQLTYHPGNDISAIWAPDGKSIYFLSQRGTQDGNYNIWKMDFNL